MARFPRIRSLLLGVTAIGALLLAAVASSAMTLAKTPVKTLDDLPRHTYKVAGPVSAMLADPAAFDAFCAAVRADVESDLATYDIGDKAAVQRLLNTLLSLDLVQGRDADVRARVEAVRALEGKEATRLTTGLVALFRSVRIVQSSEGALTAEGLVPQVFKVERNGKPAEQARFDWNGRKIVLQPRKGDVREVPLSAGAQDILSQIYQIGLAGAAARLELMIATGKNYGRYAYEAVADEMIATRFGELRTWHMKTPALPGEQAMELWLASDYRNLPVRIRFIDRKGEVFDQNAVELEVDGTALAERQQ